MIEIRDNIMGEIIGFKNWNEAELETKRRVEIHQSNFSYKYRGYHYGIKCKVTIDKEKELITIDVK